MCSFCVQTLVPSEHCNSPNPKGKACIPDTLGTPDVHHHRECRLSSDLWQWQCLKQCLESGHQHWRFQMWGCAPRVDAAAVAVTSWTSPAVGELLRSRLWRHSPLHIRLKWSGADFGAWLLWRLWRCPLCPLSSFALRAHAGCVHLLADAKAAQFHWGRR